MMFHRKEVEPLAEDGSVVIKIKAMTAHFKRYWEKSAVR